MPAQIVTSFTDYGVSPLFFRNYLEAEIAKLDVAGITNGVLAGLNVSLAHPLVRLTAAVLAAGGTGTVNFTGILPGLTVVEEDESEERPELGYGAMAAEPIGLPWVATMRAVNMEQRLADGILTDHQIRLAEDAITAAGGEVLALVNRFWMRSSVMVSLWVTKIEDQQNLGHAIRGVLLRLKQSSYSRGVRDTDLRSSSGLVNMNFGQPLFGQEFKFSFLNPVRVFQITDSPPFGSALDKGGGTMSIIDPITGATQTVEVANQPAMRLRSTGRPGEYIDPNPGSIL